ncbi:MAG TPA: hypothetical protein VHK88_04690 [Aquihabitans sp.]|nr:hypothetical protein [Aquihabitans sp.]
MPTEVYICRKCKGSDALVARVEGRLAAGGDRGPATGDVAIRMVRCQDVCKGAVAGLAVDGRLTWFRRLRGPKSAKALAKLARRGGTGPLPRRLERHHVRRRDGRPVRR